MKEIGICAVCRAPIVEKRTSPSDQFPRGESYLGHRERDRRGAIHEPIIATRSTPLFTTADVSK